jgi:hypothetical protein
MLQSRVRHYFIFLWSKQAVFDETTILDELPPHLRREVQYHRAEPKRAARAR